MRYTRELLDTILKEANATLIGEYDKYNQRIVVNFRCICGKETSKRFEMLNVYRCPYCEECSRKESAKRVKETCLKKYGVSNAAKTELVREKINNSYTERFGGHPKTSEIVQEKWKATCIEKYGGHPNQNPEVQAKAEYNSYMHKDYTLPSGKIVKIQGYEDKALDELLKIYKEDNIVIGRGNVPTLHYTCQEGIKRVYFPDFYIPSSNTILEIKSDWTIKLKTCRLNDKAKAVIEKGYKYEVWVYDSNKKNKRTLTF